MMILLERRMKVNGIKTFKIMEFLIMVNFFQYFSLNWKFAIKMDLKNKSTNQLNHFAHRVIYFLNKLPNQIKNRNSIENFEIKSDGFRKSFKKKNLSGNF